MLAQIKKKRKRHFSVSLFSRKKKSGPINRSGRKMESHKKLCYHDVSSESKASALVCLRQRFIYSRSTLRRTRDVLVVNLSPTGFTVRYPTTHSLHSLRVYLSLDQSDDQHMRNDCQTGTRMTQLKGTRITKEGTRL